VLFYTQNKKIFKIDRKLRFFGKSKEFKLKREKGEKLYL